MYSTANIYVSMTETAVVIVSANLVTRYSLTADTVNVRLILSVTVAEIYNIAFISLVDDRR